MWRTNTRSPHTTNRMHGNHPLENNPNKENQQATTLTQMTSQPSQITRNTQIGDISVEQVATSLGSNLDHLIEALEEVFTAPNLQESKKSWIRSHND